MPRNRQRDIEVFVSHSHEDYALAEAIVEFLVLGVDLGFGDIRCTSYMDTGLSGGDNIIKELRRDIDECRIFIPLITANCRSSEYVLFEIGIAWALEKKIMPVLFDPTRVAAPPTMLSHLLWRDATKPNDLTLLAHDIGGQIFRRNSQPTQKDISNAVAKFRRSTRKINSGIT